jgi:hypothetical protein
MEDGRDLTKGGWRRFWALPDAAPADWRRWAASASRGKGHGVELERASGLRDLRRG